MSRVVRKENLNKYTKPGSKFRSGKLKNVVLNRSSFCRAI